MTNSFVKVIDKTLLHKEKFEDTSDKSQNVGQNNCHLKEKKKTYND